MQVSIVIHVDAEDFDIFTFRPARYLLSSTLSLLFYTQLWTWNVLCNHNRQKCIIVCRHGYWQLHPSIIVFLVSERQIKIINCCSKIGVNSFIIFSLIDCVTVYSTSNNEGIIVGCRRMLSYRGRKIVSWNHNIIWEENLDGDGQCAYHCAIRGCQPSIFQLSKLSLRCKSSVHPPLQSPYPHQRWRSDCKCGSSWQTTWRERRSTDFPW